MTLRRLAIHTPSRSAVAALSGAALLGCATVQTASRDVDRQARTMPVPEGRALVYVYRNGLAAGMGLLSLFVNEQHVADLAVGTYCVANVPSGEVRLAFPFGNGAATLPLVVEAGRRYYVRQEVAALDFNRPGLVPVSEPEGATSLGELTRVVPVEDRDEESRAARARAPSPGSALVFVFREQWWGAGRAFEVKVNGAPVGKVGARTFVVADVPSGSVSLTVTAENEATMPLVLQPGSTAFVTMKWGMGWSAPRITLVAADEYRARAALERLSLAPGAPR
jgi:hypothetical protein